MAKKTASCCISDQHCLAPAGYRCGGWASENNDLPKSLPKCHGCGAYVCSNCSHVKDKTRYCSECFVSNFGTKAEITVLTRMYRLSGYKNARQLAHKHLESVKIS